jgi:hypothetical protein
VNIPPLRFEVKAAKFQNEATGFNLIVDFLLASMSPGMGTGGGPGSGRTVSRYPEVAVYNSIGKRRVLDVTDTDEEAADRAAVIEDDYKSMDIREWCERYNVPFSFVTEVTDGR